MGRKLQICRMVKGGEIDEMKESSEEDDVRQERGSE